MNNGLKSVKLAPLFAALIAAIISSPVFCAVKDGFYQDALNRLRNQDTDGAIIQLKNAVQSAPDFLTGWLKLGETYLSISHGAAAERAFKKAQMLGADPKFTLIPLAKAYLLQAKIDELIALEAPSRLGKASRAELLTIQGGALLEAHRLDEAQDRFTQAAALDPNAVDQILGRAMLEIRRGNANEAERLLANASRLSPDGADILYIRGELERNRGKLSEALANFEAAVARKPGHTPARLGIAAILADEGRNTEAAAAVDQSLADDPDNLQALYLRSTLQRKAGDIAAADKTLDEAAAIIASLPPPVTSEHLPSLMISAVLSIRDGNFEQAKLHLERYLARFPGHHGARKLLVQTYLQMGADVSATPVLLEMVDESPNDRELWWLLGNAYSASERHAQAIEAYERARALGLHSADLETRLGASLLAIGDSDGALQAFETAAAGEEDATQAKFMTAHLYLQRNDPAAALRVAEDLAAGTPDNPVYRNLVAALHLMLGRRAEAVTHFEYAAALDPDYLEPQLNLAEMARQDGDRERSANLYDAILQKHPTELGALRGLAELAIEQGQIEVAISWLERLRAAHNEAVSDRIVLVKLYLRNNDVNAAKAELRALRQAHPLRLDLILTEAGLEHALGNTAEARELLAEATRLSLGIAGNLRQVARSQAALHFDDDAIRNLNRARVLAPDEPQIPIAIADLKIRTGRTDEALALAERIARDHAGYEAEVIRIRGDAYAKDGLADNALNEYRNLHELESSSANVVRLASAYDAAGKGGDGITTLETWLASNPESVTVRAALGLLLMRAGNLLAAIEAYETVVRAEPGHVVANNNLAVLYDQTGDDRAVLQARRALALSPTSAATLDTAGWILSRNGETEEGLGYLREAYARNGNVPSIKYHLAQVLTGRGETSEAKQLLRDALEDTEFESRSDAEKLLGSLTGTQ